PESEVFLKSILDRCDILYIVREAEEFGGPAAAEKIPQYGRFIINEVKNRRQRAMEKAEQLGIKLVVDNT
ncbi:hypothetical protein, partial [Dissulfurispira sp.]|uniref:hypothetical protein n=1 Tax=Dissulfurispira sp. TaxID=2817609 RepID=UPI002FDA583B